MKIKDILGEADVTLKPMPGAQEVDIDGKPVGTTTTPAAATAISDLAKKGEFTPAGDEQTTSEDATDGGGVSFDSAEGFKNAIKQGIGQSDPEVNAQLDRIVVAEPDGSVDADQTIYNMLKVIDTEIIPQMVQFVKDMIATFTELTKSPEFQQVSPADQQSVLQSIKDMQATLPTIEKQAADAHAQFQQNDAQMQQNIKDRKMNQQLKGTPSTAVQEELVRWKKIAGVKSKDVEEVQSPFPSRNPGTPAAADAAAEANKPAKPAQSVMPSRNVSTKEGHKDLVSQGNHDVGGDATDNFINQVRDKKWEKANRAPASGTGTRSPLSEKDELYKWLTIAGLK
jgi:hypothetical protein